MPIKGDPTGLGEVNKRINKFYSDMKNGRAGLNTPGKITYEKDLKKEKQQSKGDEALQRRKGSISSGNWGI